MGSKESAPEPEADQPAIGDGGTWTPQVEHLLDDWRNRVYAAQAAHYSAADLFRLMNYVVGVPAVVFSSMVGTALFAGLEKDSPKTLLVASASILAAILAGLRRSFVSPARRSSRDRRRLVLGHPARHRAGAEPAGGSAGQTEGLP